MKFVVRFLKLCYIFAEEKLLITPKGKNQIKMKREDLLKAALTEDKNVKSVVETLIENDLFFLEKKSTTLGFELIELKRDFKTRISSVTPIDDSVVQVSYQAIIDLEAKIKLYKTFKTEYFSAE